MFTRADQMSKAKQIAEKISPALEEQGCRPLRTLAPGDVNRKVCSVLADIVPVEEVGEGIKEMMQATTIGRGGDEVPDYRAREAAMKLWLAYSVGMPLQRQEIVQVNVDGSKESLSDKIKSSPALRAQLKRMLEEAE